MSGAGLGELVAMVAARRPLHARFVQDAYRFLDDGERRDADAYVTHLLKTHPLDYVAASYETIVDDTFEAQLFFMQEGRYRYSKFEQVANAVYFNPDYMRRYMVGLAVSNYLWPNHVQIRRFFAQTFPWQRRGQYCEIGPGHGLFLLHAMRDSRLDAFTGLDISAASLALTDEAVRQALPGARDRLRLIEADFLAPDAAIGGPYDVLVMGEVLEHVEQPLAFLQRLRALASADAHVFVTTCINAPAIDHICLFSSEAEVAQLIADAGLSIRRSLAIPYPGKTLAQCARERLPVNVAYVLSP